MCDVVDDANEMLSVADILDNTTQPAADGDDSFIVSDRSHVSASGNDDATFPVRPANEQIASNGEDDSPKLWPTQTSRRQQYPTATSDTFTATNTAEAEADADDDAKDTASYLSSSSSSYSSPMWLGCGCASKRRLRVTSRKLRQRTVPKPSISAADPAAAAVSSGTTTSSSPPSYGRETQRTAARQRSNDAGVGRSKSRSSRLWRLLSCAGASSKSKSLLVDDADEPASPTHGAVTSLAQPEVETWQLNGETLSSVVQRVLSAVDDADNGYVSHPVDASSDKTDKRKSDCARLPSMIESSCDVTLANVEPRSEQPYSQVAVVSPSVVVTSLTGNGVIGNDSRMSLTGSSNGDQTCTDDDHAVVGPRNLPSEHEDADTLPRHNQPDRVELEFQICSGISATPDIPGVILQDPTGNSRAGRHPYGEQEVDTVSETESTVERKLIDCDTIGHEPLTSGTTRICDIVKTANGTLSTPSLSTDGVSRLNRTPAAPELEIAAYEVVEMNASEEQKSGNKTGRVFHFRPRVENGNWTRNGGKTRQREWKDVKSEITWLLGATLTACDPSPLTTTTTTTKSRRQSSMSRSDDLLSVNAHRRPRGRSVTDDAGLTRRNFRALSGGDGRVTTRRHASPSPVRRTTLTKHCHVTVLTTHDEVTLIRRQEGIPAAADKVPITARAVQTLTNNSTVHSSPVNQTVKTNLTFSQSASPTHIKTKQHDIIPDNLRDDGCSSTSLTDQRIPPASIDFPDIEASSPQQVVKTDFSSHRMSVDTLPLVERSRSNGFIKPEIGSITNVDRETEPNHLVQPSLVNAASTGKDQPDVESLSSPNESRQVLSYSASGDRPEVTSNDVTDDVTVMSPSDSRREDRCSATSLTDQRIAPTSINFSEIETASLQQTVKTDSSPYRMSVDTLQLAETSISNGFFEPKVDDIANVQSITKSKHLVAASNGEAQPDVDSLSSPNETRLPLPYSVGGDIPDVPSNYVTDDVTVTLPSDSHRGEESCVTSLADQPIPLTSIDFPEIEASYLEPVVKIDSSPHKASVQTLSLTETSTSTGFIEPEVDSIANVERETEPNHFVQPSLVNAASNGEDQLDVESLSSPNENQQVLSHSVGGDGPEVASNDVTDEVTVTSPSDSLRGDRCSATSLTDQRIALTSIDFSDIEAASLQQTVKTDSAPCRMSIDTLQLAETSISNGFFKPEVDDIAKVQSMTNSKHLVAASNGEAHPDVDSLSSPNETPLLLPYSVGGDIPDVASNYVTDDVSVTSPLDSFRRNRCFAMPLTDQRIPPTSIDFPEIEASSPEQADKTDTSPHRMSLDTLPLAETSMSNAFIKPEVDSIENIERETGPNHSVQPSLVNAASNGKDQPDVESLSSPNESRHVLPYSVGSDGPEDASSSVTDDVAVTLPSDSLRGEEICAILLADQPIPPTSIDYPEIEASYLEPAVKINSSPHKTSVQTLPLTETSTSTGFIEPEVDSITNVERETEPNHLVQPSVVNAASTGEDQLDVESLSSLTENQQVLFHSVGGDGPEVASSYVTDDVTLMSPSDSLRRDRCSATSLKDQRIPPTSIDFADIKAASLQQAVKTDSSPHRMPVDTLPLAETSTSNGFIKPEIGSITNVDRETEPNHLVQPSLVNAASNGKDQPEAESLFSANESRQVLSYSASGDRPEVTSNDVIDDVTVTSPSDSLLGDRCSATSLTDQRIAPTSINFSEIEAASLQQTVKTDSSPYSMSVDTLQLVETSISSAFFEPEVFDIANVQSITKSKHLVAASNGEAQPDVDSLWSPNDTPLLLPCSVGGDGPVVASNYATDDVSVMSPLDSFHGDRCCAMSLTDPTSIDFPVIEASSPERAVKIDFSPHEMSIQTLPLEETSTSNGFIKPEVGSIEIVERETEPNHLVQPSLVNAASIGEDQLDVENLSSPNENQQVLSHTVSGDGPEVASNYVTNDITVTLPSDSFSGEESCTTWLADQRMPPTSTDFPEIEASFPEQAVKTDTSPHGMSVDTLQLAKKSMSNGFFEPEVDNTTNVQSMTKSNHLVAASNGEAEPDVESLSSPNENQQVFPHSVGSEGPEVASNYVTNDVTMTLPSDSLRGEESCSALMDDQRIPPTFIDYPEIEASYLEPAIKINSSPHKTSVQTLPLTETSTSTGFIEPEVDSIANVERETGPNHLVQPSLLSAASNGKDQPEVESLSSPNESRQVLPYAVGGDGPEVASNYVTDDVTVDVTVTSPSVGVAGRRGTERQEQKHVGDSCDQSEQPAMSRLSDYVASESDGEEQRDDEFENVEWKYGSRLAERMINGASGDADNERHRQLSSPDSADPVLSEQSTDTRASRDQQRTGSDVVRPDVTSQRGNVDVHTEKVFLESLATSIGKFSASFLLYHVDVGYLIVTTFPVHIRLPMAAGSSSYRIRESLLTIGQA